MIYCNNPAYFPEAAMRKCIMYFPLRVNMTAIFHQKGTHEKV